MADWTDLPDAAVGVGGIPSGTTMTALRDNVIALAEGAPGAPALVYNKISETVITGSPTAVEFTQFDPTRYRDYEFVFSDVRSTTDERFYARISIDGGVTYLATANTYGDADSRSASVLAPFDATSWDLTDTTDNTAVAATSGSLRLLNPASGSYKKGRSYMIYGGNAVGPMEAVDRAIVHNTTSAVNGIRFTPNINGTDTFFSGTITMYGIT